ncbi:MAG: hypothetical protein JO288_00710 [Hyphomicrobiales bacterium]|nr:hypothetical protein [Hyphomicrobiales bacterium]
MRRKLVDGLVAFSDRNGPPPEEWRFVGFYASGEEGELAGGVQGFFQWEWLQVTHLCGWSRAAGSARASCKPPRTSV